MVKVVNVTRYSSLHRGHGPGEETPCRPGQRKQEPEGRWSATASGSLVLRKPHSRRQRKRQSATVQGRRIVRSRQQEQEPGKGEAPRSSGSLVPRSLWRSRSQDASGSPDLRKPLSRKPPEVATQEALDPRSLGKT